MDGALGDVDEHLHGVTLAAVDTPPPDDPMTKWTSLTETRLALVNGASTRPPSHWTGRASWMLRRP